jgi:hypothetical protein
MKVFIGNFNMCLHQCHIIQVTAVRFEYVSVTVRDEQNAEGLFGPKREKVTKC